MNQKYYQKMHSEHPEHQKGLIATIQESLGQLPNSSLIINLLFHTHTEMLYSGEICADDTVLLRSHIFGDLPDSRSRVGLQRVKGLLLQHVEGVQRVLHPAWMSARYQVNSEKQSDTIDIKTVTAPMIYHLPALDTKARTSIYL